MGRGLGRTGAAVVIALLMTGGITGCGDKNRAPRDVAAPVGLPTVLAEAPADQPTEAPPAVEAMGVAPSTKASPSARATVKSTPKPIRTVAGPLPTPKRRGA